VRVFPTRKNCLFFLTGLKMVVGVGFCKIKVDSNLLLVLKIKCTKFHQDQSRFAYKIYNFIYVYRFNYPTSTRRHGHFAGVHTLLRILLSSNSAVLINIITGVSPPHYDFVVYYVLCQC
jgi:hypothetical protein